MSVDQRQKTHSGDVEVPVTRSYARSLATVAEEASELAERDVVSENHQKVLELVSRKLTSELTARTTVGLFSVRDSEEAVGTIQLDDSTLKVYLDALDAIATQSPRPHRENVCQEVFSHVTESVDADGLGLRSDNYETLQVKRGVVFG